MPFDAVQSVVTAENERRETLGAVWSSLRSCVIIAFELAVPEPDEPRRGMFSAGITEVVSGKSKLISAIRSEMNGTAEVMTKNDA